MSLPDPEMDCPQCKAPMLHTFRQQGGVRTHEVWTCPQCHLVVHIQQVEPNPTNPPTLGESWRGLKKHLGERLNMQRPPHIRTLIAGIVSTLFVFGAYSYVILSAGYDDTWTAWFVLIGLGIASANLAVFIFIERRLTAQGR